MKISIAGQNNRSSAFEMLKDAHLSVDDITEETILYALDENEELNAVIGLEVYENIGLLRSLCVSPSVRGEGKGSVLVRFVEDEARRKQLVDIYLLTETASGLFEKLGYTKVEREKVPEPIRNTSQFSSVCPSSAIVMFKHL